MDATEICLDVLGHALPGVRVSSEVPAERPGAYVHVTRDGGGGDEFLDTPRMGVTCWGTSDQEAAELCRGCVDALQAAALDHPYLSSATLDTMSRESWSTDGSARYHASVDLVINK